MKKETRENIISISAISIFLIALVTFLLWFIPLQINDNKCFIKIATEVCKDEGMIFNNKSIPLNTILAISNYNYQCCKSQPTIISRKMSDNYRLCEKYIFLEKEIKQCSKKYKRFKRVW